MRISINKAHFPVTVLGPGRRLAIWVQGCSIGCAGCVSQDTWSSGAVGAEGDNRIEVDDVLAWAEELGDEVEGVTISGGEPFDQPEALEALLTGFDGWRTRRGTPEVDLLVYSGYSTARLRRLHPRVLARADAVITGPYLQRRPTDLVWRGSANQEIVAVSDLGERIYGPHRERRSDRSRLQAVAGDTSIWYVGVPLPGDMERLTAALKARGVEQQEVSWRS